MATQFSRSWVGAQPAISTAGPIVALRAGSNEIRVRDFQLAARGASSASGEIVALFRSTAVGTASTSGLGQAEDPADGASLANVDTAWSANPTIAANAIRMRPIGPNDIDHAYWHWHEQDGLVVPANGSIVLWRTTTFAVLMSATFGSIVWEE